MEKSRKEKTFAIIGFLLLLIAVVAILSATIKPTHPMDCVNKRQYEATRVFDEPDNTLDVLFFGHSGVYYGINPMEIYDKYGFTSYDCSFSVQLPWEMYDLLEQTLEKQTPKLVVVDVDQLFYDGPKYQAKYLWYEIRKVATIFDNHSAWKKLLPGEETRARSFQKGHLGTQSVSGYTGDKKMIATNKKYKISRSHLKSLDKARKLCKQKGIELVLIEVPSKRKWNYEKYNSVKEYADKNDLRFIDANQREEEFDFDWRLDTPDKGDHLNESGATKLSLWLGGILAEDYRLPDRRNDEKYAFWKDDYEEYRTYMKVCDEEGKV